MNMTKTKKSSFFGNVLNIFSEEVNEIQEEKTQSEKSASKDVPTQRMNFDNVPEKYRSTTIGVTTPTVAQAKFNEEFYNHFQDVIAQNNIDGTDYFEFKKTYDALIKSTSMGEIDTLKAAFGVATSQAPDLTIDRLLETADFYLGVIEKENDSFLGELNQTIDTEVTNREVKIEEEVELQAKKREAIVALNVELEESLDRVITFKDEITVEQSKINEVKSNWELTIGLVMRNIATDKNNIQTHLGANKK